MTQTGQAARPASKRGLSPLEAGAALGCAVVFLLALAALGQTLLRHADIPPVFGKAAVLAHFATVLAALPLAASQIVLPKGTTRHRAVGYVWCALMIATALISFAVHESNPHGFSFIHLFSALTLVFVPLLIWHARAGRIEHHRRTVLWLVAGGLVIAGLFTFVPGRALGELLGSLWMR